MNGSTTPWWRDRNKLPIIVFVLIAGYFFLAEHRAHVIEFLPWLLILGCIGMHFFMHGGHGHGGHDHGASADNSPTSDSKEGSSK